MTNFRKFHKLKEIKCCLIPLLALSFSAALSAESTVNLIEDFFPSEGRLAANGERIAIGLFGTSAEKRLNPLISKWNQEGAKTIHNLKPLGMDVAESLNCPLKSMGIVGGRLVAGKLSSCEQEVLMHLLGQRKYSELIWIVSSETNTLILQVQIGKYGEIQNEALWAKSVNIKDLSQLLDRYWNKGIDTGMRLTDPDRAVEDIIRLKEGLPNILPHFLKELKGNVLLEGRHIILLEQAKLAPRDVIWIQKNLTRLNRETVGKKVIERDVLIDWLRDQLLK